MNAEHLTGRFWFQVEEEEEEEEEEGNCSIKFPPPDVMHIIVHFQQ